MQTQDKQKIILAALALIAVFVWARAQKTQPGPRNLSGLSAEEAVVSAQDMPQRQKMRTVYKDWGPSPFVVNRAVAAVGTSGLWLGGIVYDERGGYALINDQVVRKGDQVNGNKVIDIKKDRVILNDGLKDFELSLQQD